MPMENLLKRGLPMRNMRLQCGVIRERETSVWLSPLRQGVLCCLFALVLLSPHRVHAGVVDDLISGVKNVIKGEDAVKNDSINPKKLPRLDDSGFIEFLTGSQVLVEKGIIFDDTWTIRKGEVSAFVVNLITENPADKVLCADVSFNVSSGGKGLAVRGNLRYKRVPNRSLLMLVDFTATSKTKTGNW